MTFNEWIDEQSELVNKFGMSTFIDMLPALQEAYLAGAVNMSKDNDQKQTVTCKDGLQVEANKLAHSLCATPLSIQSRVYCEGEIISNHRMPLDEAGLQLKREWVGLTDEEIREAFHPLHDTGLQFARAIEAKLKEKNT